jgi:hypothetical protein
LKQFEKLGFLNNKISASSSSLSPNTMNDDHSSKSNTSGGSSSDKDKGGGSFDEEKIKDNDRKVYNFHYDSLLSPPLTKLNNQVTPNQNIYKPFQSNEKIEIIES